MKYLCLDTGLDGAILFCEKSEPVDALRFTREGRGLFLPPIVEFIKERKPDKIYMEGILIKPGQSSKALATQWLVYGQCQTIAQLFCDEVEVVPAIRWTSFTKRLSSNPSQPSKVCMQEIAERFFGEWADSYRLRKFRGHRKIHDGVADCLGLHCYVERDKFVDLILP